MLFNSKGEVHKSHVNQLCTMLTITTGYYSNFMNHDGQLLEIALKHPFKEPREHYLTDQLGLIMNHNKETSDILILENKEMIIYYPIYLKSDFKGILFIGPMKTLDCELAYNGQDKKIGAYLESLPMIESSYLSSFLELIIIAGDTQKHLKNKELDLNYEDDITHKHALIDVNSVVKHHTLHTEEKIFSDLLIKDLNVIDLIHKSFRNLILPQLADSPLRSHKNRMIVGITVIARAAIKLGISSEEAFSASDLFISEVETLKTTSEILQFQLKVLMFYRKKVQDLVKSPSYSDSTQLLLEYLSNHFLDKASLNEICDTLSLNYKYASKKFSEELGETFTTIREQKRLEYAAHLLDTTNDSINDISERAGFNYSYYFTKKFKSTFGLTPINYRKKSLK